MLGSAMVPALLARGYDVFPTDLRVDGHPAWDSQGPPITRLDVRSRTDIAAGFGRFKPDFVVHLAAETDLEICEADPEHAFATNALGTKHVALACQAFGAELAYVSTAGVFDGEKAEPYIEYDPARPINRYGSSKLDGERYVSTFLNRFYIVRAGWMVGGGRKDHKFVAKILAQLKAGARTLYAVGDRLGTPTYAPDFARCFSQLIESRSYGLYHMVCTGQASRFDVARKILEVLGRTEDVQLVEVDSSFFRDSYPAPRPKSEAMRNLLLDLQGLNTMRPWEEALEEYLSVALDDLGLEAAPRALEVAAW
jgi:dTDP-4-dehydrorhamnose reductase